MATAKSLETLAELHRRQLDQMRRQMVTLEEQYAKFGFAIEGLVEELERERHGAEADITLRRYLPAYVEQNQQKQAMIQNAQRRLEKQMEELRQRIRNEFQTLKRYETMKARIEEEEAMEQNRRERILLDEMGVERFLRDEEKD